MGLIRELVRGSIILLHTSPDKVTKMAGVGIFSGAAPASCVKEVLK